jgi:hypothetical protein
MSSNGRIFIPRFIKIHQLLENFESLKWDTHRKYGIFKSVLSAIPYSKEWLHIPKIASDVFKAPMNTQMHVESYKT